jgi:hypothetical protein
MEWSVIHVDLSVLSKNACFLFFLLTLRTSISCPVPCLLLLGAFFLFSLSLSPFSLKKGRLSVGGSHMSGVWEKG